MLSNESNSVKDCILRSNTSSQSGIVIILQLNGNICITVDSPIPIFSTTGEILEELC